MDKRHIYTTVNGREVEYRAISLDALRMSWRGLEKQYRERGEPVDPPTYVFKTASGAEISEPHDAQTDKTPEEQTAWDAHVNALNRLQYEKNVMMMTYIFEDGLAAVQLPEDDGWLEKHKRRFVEIPEDPELLREFYLTAEVLITPEDVANIVASVMVLSQQGKVDEAALEIALESFRGVLGRAPARRAERSEK